MQTRSSISYDILHGIHSSSNLSKFIVLLNYFPPPPPFVPAPPVRRSWTCSAHSDSCFLSDDHNPSSLRQCTTINHFNQTKIVSNVSYLTTKSSHLSSSFIQFIRQHQFYLILIGIVLIFSILFLIFLLTRYRQRQVPSNKKFYYHLIPHRQKQHTNEENLVRLRKDPLTIQVHSNNQKETEETV